jgi:uncharacterized repeat protein (TIGR01451 family)
VSVVKRANRGSVTTNEPIAWTFVVTNNGPDTAAGVVADDVPELPVTFTSIATTKGTCTSTTTVHCVLGTLAAGETVTVTLVGHAEVAGTLRNTVKVASNQGGPPPRRHGRHDRPGTGQQHRVA